MLVQARAKGGFCIVMDPKTGEVLALAVRTAGACRQPFNPNEPQHYRPEEWRNRCVTDAFEPGSIFKPFLAAAALEEKVVHPLERFDCSAGKIQVADRVIKDAHENGVLTFTDVIAQSSNVGTIKVALRLGKERFSKYITAFGFGRKTGVDLPGRDLGPGQGPPALVRRVPCLDLDRAGDRRDAAAGGGRLLRPRQRRDSDEALHGHGDRGPGRAGGQEVPAPGRAGRVAAPDTCAKVNKMLQRVVEAGTGDKARPAGYTAAGKTGTAQKIDQRTRKLFQERLCQLLCGVRAGDRAAAGHPGDGGQPEGDHLRRQRGRAGVQGSGGAEPGISPGPAR